MRKLWPVAVLALVALLPTGKFLFGGMTPAPVDQVHQLAPWNGPTPETPWDILQLDGALQFLPWRDFMLASYRQGEIPFWNPYTLGGTPFLANSQTAPLYPLHFLWAAVPFGAEALLSFSAWLHLFIAGLGVYLLCRRLGANEIGGLIGGSAFALSAFMIAWIQLPSVGMTAAWIPWPLLGVHGLFHANRVRAAAGLAVSVAMMLLAGHLQIAAYGLMATVLYLVWLGVAQASRPRSEDAGGTALRLRPLLLGVAALALGFMLASPQLLPVLENGRHGHRAAPPTAEGWQAQRAQALAPKHLLPLLAPNVFGMPNEAWEGNPHFTTYWLAYEEPGRHYAEMAVYVGPVVPFFAFLAMIAFWKRPETNFFGFLVLFALLVALGTVLGQALFYLVPGWPATGSPGRVAVLIALGLCVLAGTFIRSDRTRAEMRKLPLVIAPVAFVLGIWTFGVMIQPALVESGAPWLGLARDYNRDAMPHLALAAFGAAIALFLRYGRSRRPAALGAAAILTALVPAAVHWNMNPGAERGLYKQPFEGQELLQDARVAVVNEEWHFYFPGPMTVAPPNTLLPYRVHEIGGYDSIIPRETKARLDSVNGQDSAPPTNGNMMFIKPGFDLGKLQEDGVELIVSAIPLDMEPIFDGGTWRIYRVPDPLPVETAIPAPPGTFFLGILLAIPGVLIVAGLSYMGRGRDATTDST